MAKALQTAGMIIGTVASIVPGPWQPFAIAASIALNVGGALLQKKPAVLGSTHAIQIGSRNPTPYWIGRTYTEGTMAHDVGYGPTSGGVPNPYRTIVYVDSGGGPIQGYESQQADFATVGFSGGNATGYFHDRLYLDTQVGGCPEASALAGPFGAIPGWSAAHKLSGKAARLITLRDDREGKTYSSGVPRFGAVGDGVLVYDQRQDDTYSGGSGDCRVGFEGTYVGGDAAENPACHATTYALGRWQGPEGEKRLVMGCGFTAPDVVADGPADAAAAIDWPAWTEFANVCDANGWKVGGFVWEPAGLPWDNLKRICEAGGAKPIWVGGKLSVHFPRPRTPIFEIGLDDLADGEVTAQLMTSWRTTPNVLVPAVRLETHQWERVDIEPVAIDALITADGEEKRESFPIELCQDKDQASELAKYEILNRREKGPFVLPCKIRLWDIRPGDAGTLKPDLLALIDPEDVHGLAETPMVVIGRRRDPATLTVELTLETDRPEKHTEVLGSTGSVGATPTPPTTEELDGIAFTPLQRELAVLIANSATQPTQVVSAGESGGSATVTVIDHTRSYPDGLQVTVTGDVFTGLTPDTPYYLGYEDLARAGGAVTIVIVGEDDQNDIMGPAWHQLGRIRTPVAGSGITYEGGGTYPPGAPIGRELPEPL